MMTSSRIGLAFALGFVASSPWVAGIQSPSTASHGTGASIQVGVDAAGDVNMPSQSPRRRGTVSADYGGQYRSDGGNNVHRPEAVKSLRCDYKGDNKCHLCTHETDAGCWQPVDSGRSGDMKLIVLANSDYKSFAQEVFFKCPRQRGYWNMKVNEKINGKITVYVNRKEEHVFAGPCSRENACEHAFSAATVTKKHRVRLSFVPDDPTRTASALAKVETKNMDIGVDVCMSSSDCLAKLGDGSGASFALRNNNKMQLTCLRSHGDGADQANNQATVNQWEQSEQEKCNDWDECLPSENKKIIKTLLKAAIVSEGSSSFTEVASAVTGNLSVSEDPNLCINPEVDDPESWDCECVEEMTDYCGGVDEACFRKAMCNNAEVCPSWKQEAGCAELIQSRADALGHRSHEHASNGIGDALDTSVQGKCSQ